MNSIQDKIATRIIEALEANVIPWKKPWKNGLATSYITGKPYRGINALVLGSLAGGGEFLTFNQGKKLGLKLKKGSKGYPVVFWKLTEVVNKETGDISELPFARGYTVFKASDFGIEPADKPAFVEGKPHDEYLKRYLGRPSLSFGGNSAFYQPSTDSVTLPPKGNFISEGEFLSTLFHEMVHSTGHEKRLGRKGVTGNSKFGSDPYAEEELIAELGTQMLCAEHGVETMGTVENSKAYCQSWARKFKAEPKLIISCAQKAQKASDLINNKK